METQGEQPAEQLEKQEEPLENKEELPTEQVEKQEEQPAEQKNDEQAELAQVKAVSKSLYTAESKFKLVVRVVGNSL